MHERLANITAVLEQMEDKMHALIKGSNYWEQDSGSLRVTDADIQRKIALSDLNALYKTGVPIIGKPNCTFSLP